MVFGSEPREGTNLKSPIKDVLKSHFSWILMRRKLKMLIKVMEDLISMLNLGENFV
jgi:hypothetical protein